MPTQCLTVPMVGRILALMTSEPWCHAYKCVILQDKRNFADEIKVTNQWTLKYGEYPNLSRWAKDSNLTGTKRNLFQRPQFPT